MAGISFFSGIVIIRADGGAQLIGCLCYGIGNFTGGMGDVPMGGTLLGFQSGRSSTRSIVCSARACSIFGGKRRSPQDGSGFSDPGRRGDRRIRSQGLIQALDSGVKTGGHFSTRPASSPPG